MVKEMDMADIQQTEDIDLSGCNYLLFVVMLHLKLELL